ncbi:hypothetical protein C8R46DRAFT_1029301 [Mycena filopes]|nr:hypothetical protein C8R46DRAFT_1029301 [Mycena filopes]
MSVNDYIPKPVALPIVRTGYGRTYLSRDTMSTRRLNGDGEDIELGELPDKNGDEVFVKSTAPRIECCTIALGQSVTIGRVERDPGPVGLSGMQQKTVGLQDAYTIRRTGNGKPRKKKKIDALNGRLLRRARLCTGEFRTNRERQLRKSQRMACYKREKKPTISKHPLHTRGVTRNQQRANKPVDADAYWGTAGVANSAQRRGGNSVAGYARMDENREDGARAAGFATERERRRILTPSLAA